MSMSFEVSASVILPDRHTVTADREEAALALTKEMIDRHFNDRSGHHRLRIKSRSINEPAGIVIPCRETSVPPFGRASPPFQAMKDG
jgi:hypothetical protein